MNANFTQLGSGRFLTRFTSVLHFLKNLIHISIISILTLSIMIQEYLMKGKKIQGILGKEIYPMTYYLRESRCYSSVRLRYECHSPAWMKTRNVSRSRGSDRSTSRGWWEAFIFHDGGLERHILISLTNH